MSQQENLQPLAHQVLEELWYTREHLPFKPSADIDMVWVFSAPGTVNDEPNAGPYKDRLFNLDLINEGVRIVQEVTALRLHKSVNEITKLEIESDGPVLFYNGERASKGHNYPQNEHFEALVADPNFPLPVSKVLIDDIEEVNTPGQIKQLAERLENKSEQFSNIAVVSAVQHSLRVGRYLEKYKDLFSDKVYFYNAASAQTHNESAIAGLEARKVLGYYRAGHLAAHSMFYPDPVKSTRPDLRRVATNK